MFLKTPKADHDTARINSDSALETKFRRSHIHRDLTACLSSQSEDSGISKDIPGYLLSCPRVTVTSCFVYTVIRHLESIDHLFIIPIRRIGLIHKRSFDLR